MNIYIIEDMREFCAYACRRLVSVEVVDMEDKNYTIGLMSGCGTASNLWKSSKSSGPMLMYAPLFSVLSQYLGAEKTDAEISNISHQPGCSCIPVIHRPSCSTSYPSILTS